MSSFCTNILAPKNYKASTKSFSQKNIGAKAARKMLMKLTPRPQIPAV